MQVKGYFRFKDYAGNSYHYYPYLLARDEKGRLMWYPPGSYDEGHFNRTLDFVKELKHPFIRELYSDFFEPIPYEKNDLCPPTS